jgi:hypothetical protein
MVAWLPRGLARDTKWPQDALAARVSQLDPSVLELEQASIGILRKAIHSNRASFPCQVPTFTRFDRPNLEGRIVQLYFVSGWTCSDIGEAWAEPRASSRDPKRERGFPNIRRHQLKEVPLGVRLAHPLCIPLTSSDNGLDRFLSQRPGTPASVALQRISGDISRPIRVSYWNRRVRRT